MRASNVTVKRSKRTLYFSTSAFALAMIASAASAQVAPSTVDPGQVIKRLERETPRRAPVDIIIDKRGDEAVARGGDATKAFTLESVSLEGSSVYSSSDLESVYGDRVGQAVSFADLQGLARELTAKYRADGYILSRVILPPQKISGGRVTFRAVEGYVSNVTINGDIQGDQELLQAYADKIKSERPVRAETMERYLLLMDDLPGVTARSVLQASPSETGGTDMAVTLSHDFVEGALQVDNHGNRFLGRYQLTGTLAANSALGMYERNTFRVLSTAEFEEVLFGDYTYEHQLGEEGSRLTARIAYTDVEPGSSLKPLNIEGETKLFELDYLYPWIRTRNENLNFTSEFRVQNSENDILGTQIFDDRVRTVSAGIEYDKVDNLDGVNQLEAGIRQGIDVLGASTNGVGRSRVNGEHTYTAFEAALSRIQDITETWSLFAGTAGQYSNDNLLTSEQFAIGGRGFGRGYDGSEILGDKGVAGKLELRYGDLYDPEGILQSYQLYAFYDIGTVWLNTPLVGEEARESLSSTGMGVRFNLMEAVSGEVEVALPLTRNVASEGDDDPRFFFNLIKRF